MNSRYKELKKNFHNGKNWSMKMADQWANDKKREKYDIDLAVFFVRRFPIDATFKERFLKKYREKRIKKNTSKLTETDSIKKHFHHFKQTTNWTENEIFAFINKHFHNNLTVKQLKARIKYYK